MTSRIVTVFATAWLAIAVSGCGGGGGTTSLPHAGSNAGIGTSEITGTQTVSHLSGGTRCSVSVDGLISYALPQGDFAPLLASHSNCDGMLSRGSRTITPAWATPSGTTQAEFAVVSLQDTNTYQQGAMQTIAQTAHALGEPATWMACTPTWMSGAQALYQQYRAQYGDDLEVGPSSSLIALAQSDGFIASVAVECGGSERSSSLDQSLEMNAFWGIAWNQDGTDGIADLGAPWGTYCADVASYKRPSPNGDCSFVAMEWTARDLTASYFSGRPDIYSTNPDDLMIRGAFSSTTASTYAAQIVDAYAAAGASQQFGLVFEEEPGYLSSDPGEQLVLQALYSEAKRDGMKAATLAQLASDSKAFAATPRAVAFPVIAPQPNANWVGTIDFHDNAAAMTFVAGQTLPSRVFEYSQATSSIISQPLPQVPSSQLPQLTSASIGGGKMTFSFNAQIAGRFGVAIWTDPSLMGFSGANVYPAGHAGAVIVFDLPSGKSTQSVSCSACTSSTLSYST